MAKRLILTEFEQELSDRVKFLEQRRDELQKANNRYLERARNAEMTAVEVRIANEALADKIDFMHGEYDAAVTQNLTEQTWLRMRLARAESDIDAWVEEAKVWAKAYAELRQKVDTYTIRLGVWIANLKMFGHTGMFLDVILWLTALAVIVGLVPPAIWGR